MASYWKRINTILLLLVLLAVIGALASRAFGGPLDPPGPPSATGTLPQVEPRSPIPPVGWDGVSAISINSAGSYFLTRNLTQVPITIAADNVTFDLQGFILTGGAGQTAIEVATSKRGIVIRNGMLVGPGTGVGFGIFAPVSGRDTFSDLQISGWSEGLAIGTGSAVVRVSSHDNAEYGIEVDNNVDFGGSIDDSNFSHNYKGIVLFGNNTEVRHSVMDTNGDDGILLIGSWNGVSDSHMIGNTSYGADMSGNRNVVVRNHIDGNTAGGIHNSGAGNIIGPLYPLGSTTDPEANTGF